MAIETLGEAWQHGWRVTARCSQGKRDGMKSVRECVCTYDLDMSTLLWTRGKTFPLALLASRLKCPHCGSRSVSLLFHTPKNPAEARVEHQPPRNREWKGFESRAGGARWKASKPFHVALEDHYIRKNWDEIDVLCRLNGIPFEATGEHIHNDGHWCVYQFADRVHALMFWDRFKGRWLHQDRFTFPERPDNLPAMKTPEGPKSWARKPPDLRR